MGVEVPPNASVPWSPGAELCWITSSPSTFRREWGGNGAAPDVFLLSQALPGAEDPGAPGAHVPAPGEPLPLLQGHGGQHPAAARGDQGALHVRPQGLPGEHPQALGQDRRDGHEAGGVCGMGSPVFREEVGGSVVREFCFSSPRQWIEFGILLLGEEWLVLRGCSWNFILIFRPLGSDDPLCRWLLPAGVFRGFLAVLRCSWGVELPITPFSTRVFHFPAQGIGATGRPGDTRLIPQFWDKKVGVCALNLIYFASQTGFKSQLNLACGSPAFSRG